jgi:quercetin dioxygenase-like cupin family protein
MSQRFFYHNQLPRLAVANDLFDVRFISTDNITVAFNTLKTGAEVPPHQHMHETIDYILEGDIEMSIGDEKIRMFEGMVARIPSNVVHSAKAITNCKVINIFYPAREDFKAM